MLRLMRVIAGLLAASVVAALVLAAHVFPLVELATIPMDDLMLRLPAMGQLTALLATQFAMFVVPLGVLLASVCELNRWRGWIVHLGFGLLVAAAGYWLQYQGEGDERTVLNAFAVQVFALQGLFGGLAYWLVAGRYSGWRKGGGPQRAEPYPVGRPKLQVAEATEPTERVEKASAVAAGGTLREAMTAAGPGIGQPVGAGKPVVAEPSPRPAPTPAPGLGHGPGPAPSVGARQAAATMVTSDQALSVAAAQTPSSTSVPVVGAPTAVKKPEKAPVPAAPAAKAAPVAEAAKPTSAAMGTPSAPAAKPAPKST